MELRFYTPELNLIGIMENQTSLTWTRRYFEPGEFRLFAPVTEENLFLSQLGNILWLRGSDEAAVVEDRRLEESMIRNQLEIRGRFISSYMDRRLIRPKISFTGRTEVAMRKILTDAVPIPLVELGDLNGFPETVAFEATYKNLLEYEKKLARGSGIGFRFRPDFSSKKIIFETYKGADRTRSSGGMARVVFSESYANLNNAIYRENNQLQKTTVYIGGSGEGLERRFVSYGDEYTGLERRELFVDARDLNEADYSAAEYEAVLLQRGHERHAEWMLSSSFECETDASSNFVYKYNYDLGDIATINKQSWGISADMRITEITEIYEHGSMQVSPTFGDPLKETIDWSDE